MCILNFLYYHTFIDLILDIDVQKNIASFLTESHIKDEVGRNIMVNILSKKYRPEPQYTEDIYICISNINQIILLYEDRYCKGEIFLFFNIINTDNGPKLLLNSLTKNSCEYTEYYGNNIDNFYLNNLIKKSLSDIPKNINYDNTLELYKNILSCKNINSKLNYFDIQSDIKKIIKNYEELYENIIYL